MIQRPNEVWVADPAPGGWICGVCLYPVATEPSDAHQPHAIASAWMRADR